MTSLDGESSLSFFDMGQDRQRRSDPRGNNTSGRGSVPVGAVSSTGMKGEKKGAFKNGASYRDERD